MIYLVFTKLKNLNVQDAGNTKQIIKMDYAKDAKEKRYRKIAIVMLRVALYL